MTTLRPDEAAELQARLQRSRPDLLSEDWQEQASIIETAIALAIWRAQPINVRLAVIAEWLEIFRGLEKFPIRWRSP